uniref:Uncharacterized protein n=1 Tax=Chelonoidis abingdonii TaxID=106734 RepID=A0A8C0IU61_CHEAB
MEEQKENRLQEAHNEAVACAKRPALPALTPAKQHCRLDGKENNGQHCTSSSSDYGDSVYKEIAVTNGYVNRMSRGELSAKLAEFKLETRREHNYNVKRGVTVFVNFSTTAWPALSAPLAR